ncbi:MAG: HD domain-containing phosphohydrolase [Alkalispirochaeta sp.]
MENGATHVLIAEDSGVQRKILSRHLASLDYPIIAANDGREALELFLSHQPRIVITDIEMPKMDGLELIRRIRETGSDEVHIMVLSSIDRKDTVVKALSLGADDYLVKPFHPDELTVRLASAERKIRIFSQERIITLMAKLTDYRSPETGYHIERVQKYTEILGEILLSNDHPQLNRRLLNTTISVSALHDIGKIAIPDEILNKPGKLTEAEFRLMQSHAPVGANILDEAYREIGSEVLRVARDVTRSHHERYDGEGYPDGLSGHEIPLPARIVALADVFDALSSARVYKEPFSPARCREIITEEYGRHFDPQVTRAFLDHEEKFWTIHRLLQDER